MKNIKALSILSLILATSLFMACSDDKDDGGGNGDENELTLSRITLSGLPGQTYHVEIHYGSGDYATNIDNKEIASLSVEPGEEYDILVIATKDEGSGIITVTDNETGVKATLLIDVTKIVARYKISEVRYAVDADSPEDIEAELETAPYPADSKIIISYESGPDAIWTVEDKDGKEITAGTVKMEVSPEWWTAPESYGLLPPSGQIYARQVWTVNVDGAETIYCMYIVDGPLTRLYVPPRTHTRIYEDLTAHYAEAYPQAGVRGVVRLLLIN